MKLEEEFVGKRDQFAELLQQVGGKLAADQLTLRGRHIQLPDVDMEYKISYKYKDGENKLSVSIDWLSPEGQLEP